MKWPSKPYIERLRPYEPGRPIEEVQRALGLKRLDKLASNENPLGVSKKVQRAIRRFIPNIHFYPESSGPLLLDALSKKLGVGTDQIILGNGSNEIIEFLCRGLVSESDEVLSSECSFLVYPLITQICGARYREVPMKNYGYDLKALGKAITKRTRLVFIANPNNPTGTYVNGRELDQFVDGVPENVVVCLDEAYVDFVEARDFKTGLDYIKRGRDNVIMLRTFSKSYGLAGLRIGFGVAHRGLIQYLHRVRQPFNVNAVAQTAALAALEDRSYFRQTQKVVRDGRKFFYQKLKKIGLQFVPSQANFVLMDVGQDARPVVERLLHKGLIVRPMHAYNLMNHIRVSIGLPAQNARFIRALRTVLNR